MKSCIFSVIFVLSTTAFVFCQTVEADLRREIDEIKQHQRLMEKDLSEIKSILLRLTTQQLAPQQQLQQQPAQKPGPPPSMNITGTEFDIGNNPVLGNESAKLILVEFSDYQCPFCGRYARETFPGIKEQYIDKGIIRYVVIDQPLPIHQDAPKAAEAAHCAGEQGRFWEMHEAMMSKQDSLKDLSSYAKTLKLNIGEFENCLSTGRYRDSVNKNMALANSLGVNGVPGFIIGTVDTKDPRKVTGVSMIRGAMPFGAFQQELDAALNNR
jgi:protein-disulfide isomerase